MFGDDDIPPTFIQHAADILADTNAGLSGPNIVKATAAYAVKYDVRLPHPTYPFGAINKRTALYENLMAFNASHQYEIIKALCDHPTFSFIQNAKSKERKNLKVLLVTRYGHLACDDQTSEVNESLVEETRHWLDTYPAVLKLFNDALEKHEHGGFDRNLLDDLRLALEKLLQAVLANSKSLENQLAATGVYIQERGGSKELANMFRTLIDYYAKYQNTYVKHDDAVIEEEIEFVVEITSSFMKHLIRLQDE